MVLGGSGNRFYPDSITTRGQFATILWRLAGSPEAAGGTPFTDVEPGAYYEAAINWAYEKGIVLGTSATTASPDWNVTRQEVITMLYRYARFAGQDVSVRGDLSGFSDAAQVPAWAAETMAWSVGEGIVKGADGMLMPGREITRAEMITMLVRFTDK